MKTTIFAMTILLVGMVHGLHAEDIPASEAYGYTTSCYNGKWDCYWMPYGKPDCDPATGKWFTSTNWILKCNFGGLSNLGFLSKDHRHEAVDYQVEQVLPGTPDCGSCGPDQSAPGQVSPGTGRLDAFALKRYRRSLSYYGSGSFGKAHYSNYDYRISIFYESTHHGSGVGGVNVYIPDSSGDGRYFEEYNAQAGDNSVDGIYHERGNYFKNLVLYDAVDQITADQSLCTKAIVTCHNGDQFVFEIYIGNQNVREGRLVEIKRVRGTSTLISYVDAVGSLPTTDPEREKYWRIDTVTDEYGQTAQFHYIQQTYGWTWVISKVDCPNGTSINYAYTNGHLSNVTYPDGTTSSFTYGHDAATQKDFVVYNDAGATGNHRRKTAYYNATSFQLPDTTVINQTPGQFIRAHNPMGETIAALWDTDIPGSMLVYAGGNDLRYFETTGGLSTTYSKIYQCLDYNHNDAVITPNLSGLTWNLAYSFTANPYISKNESSKDTLGRETFETFDHVNRNLDGMTYKDGSTDSRTYNQFNSILTETDRLGRVTTNTYDANNNLLTKTHATGQPEASTWTWTYNAKGQPVTFTDANGNTTDYTYDSNGYLIKITQPPDNPGDPRAEITFTYTAYGRLSTQVDALGRTTTYAYDDRNRVLSKTYADTSSDTMVYGTGTQANLLVASTDRSGSTTTFDYDDYGRVIETVYGSGTPESITETCTYFKATTKKASCVRAGELTTYGYDFYNHVVSVARQANTNTTLTSTSEYDILKRRFKSTDAYGRSTYHVFDLNDRLARTVQETVPGALTLPAIWSPLAYIIIGEREAYLNGLTRITTPNAPYLITDYVYDSEGQLTSVTDPRGIQSTYTYDQQGRRTHSVEAAGTTIAATKETIYDNQGNVIEVRSPRYFDSTDTNGYQKARTSRTYTGRNLLKTETVADGSSVAATRSTTYFLDGRKQADTDFRGNVIDYAWGFCCARFQALIEPLVTLPDGVTPERPARISRHNDFGDLTHEAVVRNYDGSVFPTFSDPTNVTDIPDAATINETTTAYDALHRPIAKTVWLSPRGAVDANNPPIAGENGIPAADGLTTRWTYDDNLTDGIGLDATYAAHLVGLNLGIGSDGRAVATINPENETSVTIYDGLGRVVKSIDGNGNADSVTYDAVVTIAGLGDVLEVTAADALGHSSKARSDGAGRHIQSIDAESHATNYSYDANSNLVSYRDPNNVGHDCVFDERNRDVSYTDTQGDTIARAYDANNNLVTMTDALNNDTTCVFDTRDRKASCTDRINATTAYAYDANNNVLSITDAEGSVTTYTFDARNLQVLEVYPTGNAGTTQKTFGYDGARRLVSRLVSTAEAPLSSETTNYVYDMANRMLERQYPDETSADDVFTYDNASRLLTATSNRYSNIVTRAYDDASRLTSESLNIDGNNYVVAYAYDVADRQTGITYPNGKQVLRSYTDRNQLQSVSYDSTVLSTSIYDAGMRETNRNLANGVNTVKSYRNDSLISDIDVTKGATNILDLAYTYDANKRKLTETDALRLDASQTFNYDNEDRLTNWGTESGVTNQIFTLSPVGDWDSTVRTGTDPINETRVHTDVHEVTAINGNALTYDFKGNLATNAQNSQDYIWDAENRMKSISNSVDADYRYDALGRRVQKSVTDNSVTTTTTFVCGGAQVFTEYVNGVESQSYVYATYVDDPIALIKANGDTSFYHLNHLFSVEVITDGSGNLVETYDYDSHGKMTIRDAVAVIQVASAVGNAYGFTGRRLDAESGLYYYRARYFDATLGRFISRDPMRYIDGMNLYRGYFIPMGLDPTGMFGIDAINEEIQDLLREAVEKLYAGMCHKMCGIDCELCCTGLGFAGAGSISAGIVKVGHKCKNLRYPWAVVACVVSLIGVESKLVYELGLKVKDCVDACKPCKKKKKTSPPTQPPSGGGDDGGGVGGPGDQPFLCPPGYCPKVVRDGDTIWREWKARGEENSDVGWDDIQNANDHLKNIHKIKAGDIICVPCKGGGGPGNEPGPAITPIGNLPEFVEDPAPGKGCP